MHKRLLYLLPLLALVCSILGTLITPQSASALADGWVNRTTINYSGQIFTDSNTYTNSYIYTSSTPNPSPKCTADQIIFDVIQTDDSNVTFFYDMNHYGDKTYDRSQKYLLHYDAHTLADGTTIECVPKKTPLSNIPNPQNRKITFYMNATGQIVSIIRPSIVFSAQGNSFAGHSVYYRNDETACRDIIVLAKANQGDLNTNITHDSLTGSSVLYAVTDSGGNKKVAESYNDITGLTTIKCNIRFPGKVYEDITERGNGYGVTAYDMGSGAYGPSELVANGLKDNDGQIGYWDNSSDNRWDDAFVIYIGNESANLQPAPITSPTGEDAAQAQSQDQCTAFGPFSWILCDITINMVDALGKVDNEIMCLVKINTAKIFNNNEGATTCTGVLTDQNLNSGTSDSSSAYKTAWKAFRTIAYVMIIIFALIMVISQIAGMDIFDAYTIKKMLPRLLIAVIFVALSWNIMELLFTMANASANAVQAIISAPFTNLPGAPSGQISMSFISAYLTASLSGIVTVTGAAALMGILGWGGFFSLILTGILVFISAFVLLVARDVVATLLIVMAPLAIVLSAFEPTKKAFSFWKTLLITLLLSLPTIAAVIQISHEAALVSWVGGQKFVSFVIFIMGYALIWTIFKKIDSVAGKLGDVVSSVTSKARKGLSEYRGNAAKKRLGEAVEGRRRMTGANWVAGLARRGKLSSEAGIGAFGITKKGRAKYAEAVRTMQAQTVGKMLEQDRDRAGGDDTAMSLLMQRGMTENRFIREYAALQHGVTAEVAEQRARNALGLSQTSLGARVGTGVMQVAAAKSLVKSNTSYRKNAAGQEMTFAEMNDALYGDMANLVNQGLITVADGAAIIKSNTARADRAGVGFGAVLNTLDQVARGGKVDSNSLANEVLTGTGPGQMVGQRHETIRLMAPEMLKRLKAQTDNDGYMRELAAIAGRYDVMAQISPLNAGIMADELMSKETFSLVGPNGVPIKRTVQQAIEDSRGDPLFMQRRREYQAAAQLQASATAAAAAAAAGNPVGQIPNIK